jgi:hypothetical protein
VFKFLTLMGIFVFFVWLIKSKFRQRKLRAQGIIIEQKGMRPITLMSIVMLVMYGGYLVYFMLSGGTES